MRNYCYSIIGYIDGLGLDPADISSQDLLDLGVCYQRLPGCRSHSSDFIPLDQIALEDMDPMWRKMVEQNSLIITDSGINHIFAEEEEDVEDEPNRWDPRKRSFTDINPWSPSDMDLVEMDIDRRAEMQAIRISHDLYWNNNDERSRKRADHPLRENRRQRAPLHQLPPRDNPPLQ